MPAVLWARFGLISRAVARSVKPLSPPLLIISLPRSGSSWVGKTLGIARNALYLREPISQGHLARYKRKGVVFKVTESQSPPGYASSAEDAFLSLPRFPAAVVKYPDQWALGERRSRRLVIKEVNPLALGWLVGRYRPRVVYLIRHPAAVAASFSRLGWIGDDKDGFSERRFSAERLGLRGIESDRFSHSVWAEHGALQAIAMRTALEALNGYDNQLTIKYEDVCLDPKKAFLRLYEFAELEWDEHSEQAVHRQSSLQEHNRYESYSTYRNSRAMIGSWRQEVDEHALTQLKEAYLRFHTPHYGKDEW